MDKQKFKSIINAFRPWTLYTALGAVGLGAVWALHDGFWNWGVFIATLLGGCLLQAASNLFNTYGDFASGVDNIENSVRSPELVQGRLQPKTILYMGYGSIFVTCLLGIYLIVASDWKVLIFGLVGIVFAYGYTMGMKYKYHGLGLIFVFILMGEIMVLGSYYVFAQTINWWLLLIAVPNGCLITAILNGNELRDFYSDRESNLQTLSVKMGYNFSFRLYQILHILPFIVTGLLVILRILSPWTLLVFLMIPNLVKIIKNMYKSKTDKQANLNLVIYACKFHWYFILLMILGILIDIFI
ncbi:MAG: 1,4-dihydroxy-2-naphthoate octaprenyltransferase [Bacillota bacterium]|jgi:1,4-dihydroxy-2-naphthoate octaprenyltransferase